MDKQVFTFKIIFISMFFGLHIPFILSELESKEKLRKYFNISEVLSANQVYKIFSLKNPEKLMKALNHILNSRNHVKRRIKKTFLVDAIPVELAFSSSSANFALILLTAGTQ